VKYRVFFLLTHKGWADVPLHRTPCLGTLSNRLRKREKKIPSDNNLYEVKKDSPELQQMLYDTDYEVLLCIEN